MFIRPSAIVLSIAALAIAAPNALEARQSGSCNTGSLQCCNSVQDASSYTSIFPLLQLLGVNTATLTGQIGSTCSPITTGGTGTGSSCTSQPVCCSGNNFNGLLVIGCSPITING